MHVYTWYVPKCFLYTIFILYQTQRSAHIAQSDPENVCMAHILPVDVFLKWELLMLLQDYAKKMYTMSSFGLNPCSNVWCHISTLINNSSLSVFCLYLYLCLIFTMYVTQCKILLRLCIVLDVVCAMFNWDVSKLLTCITLTNPTPIPTVLPHYPLLLQLGQVLWFNHRIQRYW